MRKQNLHIVILAAGLSQRLGFPKQLIVKNGMTLLEKKIRLALNFTTNVWVVLPDIDRLWAKQLFEIAQRFMVQIVTNPTPQTGIAQSIQQAYYVLVKQNLTVADRLVFLTVDQVALNAAALKQLMQAVDNQTLIASRYQQAGEPAILGIPVNMPFGFLADFVAQLQGDKGFGKILTTLSQSTADYKILAVDLPKLVWDIDTPLQFKELAVEFDLLPPPLL